MEIRDDGIRKVEKRAPVEGIPPQEEAQTGESGLSSIEKSRAVKPEAVPLMSVPLLAAPANMESVAFAVASVDGRGLPVTETVMSFVLKGEEIKESVLKGWMDNLREIEEQVRQLLRSPIYIQLQEIRRKGDPQLNKVSGVQSPVSAHAAAKAQPVDFLSTLDRLQTLEHVPPSAEVSETEAPRDSSQVMLIPLAAALIAGGGLAMATTGASQPLGGVFELVQKIQLLFPQVAVQDLIPIINLMAVAPIYFNSWNEAVSNLRSGERRSYVQTAQNFAKDVIKIVADPKFVNGTLVSRMKGTDQLSPENQERLASILKIVLIGVSLSLLYSVEVGKVQGGSFGGIEPEELRDLILGKWVPPAGKKLSQQEELTGSLIKRIHEQMQPLSAKDREFAANLLLDYITQPRGLDPMLDPAKVFDETLSSSLFNPKDKIDRFKA
jgi:hypothetical protein